MGVRFPIPPHQLIFRDLVFDDSIIIQSVEIALLCLHEHFFLLHILIHLDPFHDLLGLARQRLHGLDEVAGGAVGVRGVEGFEHELFFGRELVFDNFGYEVNSLYGIARIFNLFLLLLVINMIIQHF